MTLASNLDEVYRVCDPDKPLSADDKRYVDLSKVRGTKVLATKIARRISRCDSSQFHRQLITGHRGCGKSTELLRLKKELEVSVKPKSATNIPVCGAYFQPTGDRT